VLVDGQTVRYYPPKPPGQPVGGRLPLATADLAYPAVTYRHGGAEGWLAESARIGVTITKVNIGRVELDATLDEAGFRHAATAVGDRLGARRIGAGVYEARADAPIWPYHYHHGIEEYLYVMAGAPVLRDPSRERQLAPGDLVRFPSGHIGAHTVRGPGRLVIVATGQHDEPWMSVYPDSDKVSGPGGILLRTSAVGYWHGEGTAGPSGPVEIAREPETSPPQAVVNVHAMPHPVRLESGMLAATVIHLGPGESSGPYRYVWGREEWLLVLAGTPAVRHAGGEDELEADDLVCLLEGPAGAHELLNRSASDARVLSFSTTGFPANVCYPQTRRWRLLNAPGEELAVGET
jgi:uncharacterized cupin superfamily protein